MVYQAGLDIGSFMSKSVIIEGEKIISYSILPSSGKFQNAAVTVLNNALEKANLTFSDLKVIGATGLGASFIPYSYVESSEVSCQSRGIKFLFPSVNIAIEVGDQSTRVIKVTDKGRVADCVINDRCAAGSGRILQIIAKVLRINLEEMGALSVKSSNPVRFSTGCSVFAETEAISRIAEGASKEDIIAGLHQAMAIKIYSMIQKIKMEEICAITGGGAKDIGLIKTIERVIKKELLVPEEPLISGAIGAALIAVEKSGILE